jgi:hypothetical protein
MTTVFIVIQVPWLECDPRDAYETETAVQVHKTFFSKEKAIDWANKYAIRITEKHQKIIKRTNEEDEFCLWVVERDANLPPAIGFGYDFNKINGIALRVVKQNVT